MKKMQNTSGTWEGIDRGALPYLRAKRWTQKSPPKDIAFDEEQAKNWYAPTVVRDNITTVQGRYVVNINRVKRLEVIVSSDLYWIEPRKMIAVRMWCSSREVAIGKAAYSTRETYSYAKITEFEHTWFFERYMSGGQYYLGERTYRGMHLLERLRTMAALRFD